MQFKTNIDSRNTCSSKHILTFKIHAGRQQTMQARGAFEVSNASQYPQHGDKNGKRCTHTVLSCSQVPQVTTQECKNTSHKAPQLHTSSSPARQFFLFHHCAPMFDLVEPENTQHHARQALDDTPERQMVSACTPLVGFCVNETTHTSILTHQITPSLLKNCRINQ